MQILMRGLLVSALFAPAGLVLAKTLPVCPDIKKIESIGKELAGTFKQDVCANKITPAHVQWAMDTILPNVMSKEFLGVPPPPNWQLMSYSVSNCYQQGDLCSKTVQREFANCISLQLPLILMQWGPWINENCEQLNKTVVVNWKKKKPQVELWINAVLQKISES